MQLVDQRLQTFDFDDVTFLHHLDVRLKVLAFLGESRLDHDLVWLALLPLVALRFKRYKTSGVVSNDVITAS